MASVTAIGVPGQPMNAPPLTPWQAAVRDALNSSDVTVNSRIASAVTRSASGAAVITTAAGGETTVTFPAGRFTTPPVVVAGCAGGSFIGVFIRVSAVTATTATIQARNAGGSPTDATVAWHALASAPGATLLPGPEPPPDTINPL